MTDAARPTEYVTPARRHTDSHVLPAVAPVAATLTTFSEWRVDDPSHQHPAMHAAIDAWNDFRWPDGLLSHTCLAADDGTTLRHHAIWSAASGFEETTATSAARFEAIQAAAGTVIERLGVGAHHPPRSFATPNDRDEVGCVVIVDVTLDEPDRAVQHQWIDSVLEALANQAPDGLLAAHFHPSTDGASIVNYAHWSSARAHDLSLTDEAERTIAEDRRWQRVRTHPAIAASRVTRYRHHRTAAAMA